MTCIEAIQAIKHEDNAMRSNGVENIVYEAFKDYQQVITPSSALDTRTGEGGQDSNKADFRRFVSDFIKPSGDVLGSETPEYELRFEKSADLRLIVDLLIGSFVGHGYTPQFELPLEGEDLLELFNITETPITQNTNNSPVDFFQRVLLYSTRDDRYESLSARPKVVLSWVRNNSGKYNFDQFMIGVYSDENSEIPDSENNLSYILKISQPLESDNGQMDLCRKQLYAPVSPNIDTPYMQLVLNMARIAQQTSREAPFVGVVVFDIVGAPTTKRRRHPVGYLVGAFNDAVREHLEGHAERRILSLVDEAYMNKIYMINGIENGTMYASGCPCAACAQRIIEAQGKDGGYYIDRVVFGVPTRYLGMVILKDPYLNSAHPRLSGKSGIHAVGIGETDPALEAQFREVFHKADVVDMLL